MSTEYAGISSKMGGHNFATIVFYREYGAVGSAKELLTVPRKNEKVTENGSAGHVRAATLVKAGHKRKGKTGANSPSTRQNRLSTLFPSCSLVNVGSRCLIVDHMLGVAEV